MGLIGRKTLEAIQNVTDDEFKNYVGLNAYKFMSVREKLRAGGLGISFSWAAFLFGPFWAAYRKLWGWFFLYLVVYALVYPIYNNGLLFSVFCLLGGFVMSSSYVQTVSKKIYALKLQENSPERLKLILASKGGASKFNVFVAVILWLSGVAILVGAYGLGAGNQEIFSSASLSQNADPLQTNEEAASYEVGTSEVSKKSHLASLPIDRKEEELLPECDSKRAERELKKTLEQNGVLQLLDWSNLTEVDYSEEKGLRRCVGEVVLSNGRTLILYDFSKTQSGQFPYLIEVREITDPFERVMLQEAFRQEEKKATKASVKKEISSVEGLKASDRYAMLEMKILSGKGKEAISDGVGMFDVAYKESGVLGVVSFLSKCYETIVTASNSESLIFCLAFDIAAGGVIRDMETLQGYARTSEYDRLTQRRRTAQQLRAYGISDLSEQDEIIRLVVAEVDAAFKDKLAGEMSE